MQNITRTIIKSWFSRMQKNSSSRFAEEESDWLIFHCKIEQTTKKAAKLLIKSFTEELTFSEEELIETLIEGRIC